MDTVVEVDEVVDDVQVLLFVYHPKLPVQTLALQGGRLWLNQYSRKTN